MLRVEGITVAISAVTILRGLSLAVETGCGGIVCAAADVHEAKQLAPRLLAVVPGIRPPDAAGHDQRRRATPREALEAGADLLVVGRAVTTADNPKAAAAALVGSLSASPS